MTFSMVTYDADDDRFRPGSPVYLGSFSSSSWSSSPSPNRACSSCIGGLTAQRFPPTSTHPSRLLQPQDRARFPPIQSQRKDRKIIMSARSQGEEVEIGRIIKYSLSPTTTMIIQKGDITKWSVDRCSDAIVNATNELMFGQAGVHGAIHRAAGTELYEACCFLPDDSPYIRCPTGQARITLGYKLPASRIIHTVGPVYGASIGPQALLESAYRSSLSVAKEHNIQYIAFPAVSCGERGYPYDEAANIAISTIKKNSHGLKEVHFVLFLDELFDVWCDVAKKLL